MVLEIPDFALIMLIGPSGAGKSSFARQHFAPTEILSSDRIRAMICDDENNQTVNEATFATLNLLLEHRLSNRRLTVIDATNLEPESRRPLMAIAGKQHCPVFAVAIDLPLPILMRRRLERKDRTIPEEVITAHVATYKKKCRNLEKEGIRKVFRINSVAALDETRFTRIDPWAKNRHDPGPFDIIGDVHGCYVELIKLVKKLGYKLPREKGIRLARHPLGRKLVFVGDLVDRGPQSPEVMAFVMAQVQAGLALCAPGNHDMKLWRHLKGHKVSVRHGLETTIEQLATADAVISEDFLGFCNNLESHLILDEGQLLVVHGAIKERYVGRTSKRIWSYALYGDVTGQLSEAGLPIRANWAENYQGDAYVVYGHTPVTESNWENKTINIDTGCVFGHRLTALRYPELSLVSVKASKNYYPQSQRPELELAAD